jgi:hypothetical protein
MSSQETIVFSSLSPIREGWMNLNAKSIHPSIYQQLWPIILPAANYVQNPRVSSWFHALCPALAHRFVLLRRVARQLQAGPVILEDDLLCQSYSL